MRCNLHLTAAPGTIASAVALTSHSGFGELLYPYDDDETLRQKLAHLRFSLDPRTGAIVADEFDYDEQPLEAMVQHMRTGEDPDKVEMQKMGDAMSARVSPALGTTQELPYDFEQMPLVRTDGEL
jgi:hypothetical protein